MGASMLQLLWLRHTLWKWIWIWIKKSNILYTSCFWQWQYPPGVPPPGVHPSADADQVALPLTVGEWIFQFWDEHVERMLWPKSPTTTSTVKQEQVKKANIARTILTNLLQALWPRPNQRKPWALAFPSCRSFDKAEWTRAYELERHLIVV